MDDVEGGRNVSDDEVMPEVEPGDPRLLTLFGPSYPTVARFAELLADEGVTRGLIGPREVPRLWDRHLVNSAAVAAFLPAAGTVLDVGSGAGLPGVVLAAMRPDLHVVLLEPMERRVAWLREVIDALGLTSAEVLRSRAEEQHRTLRAEAVTARAVAPLDRLVRWTLPLLRTDGVLLAMKGSQAQAELAAARSTIGELGGGRAEVLEAQVGEGLTGTTVVRVVRVLDTIPVAKGVAGSVPTEQDAARRGGRRSPGRPGAPTSTATSRRRGRRA